MYSSDRGLCHGSIVEYLDYLPYGSLRLDEKVSTYGDL
jgi:hypothetical protein